MADMNGTLTNGTSTAPSGSEVELMIAYAAIHGMALLSIVMGCFRSLAYVQQHEREKTAIMDSIRFKDVRMFPVKASIALLAFYAMIKQDELQKKFRTYSVVAKQTLLDKMHDFSLENTVPAITNYLKDSLTDEHSQQQEQQLNVTVANATQPVSWLRTIVSKQNIQFSLTVFICVLSLGCLVDVLNPLFQRLCQRLPDKLAALKRERFYKIAFLTSRKKNFSKEKALFSSVFSRVDAVTFVLMLPLLVFHVVSKHWISNNIFGIAISISGIGSIHLSSYKAGAVLLAGLFVYDVFWVFATNVMTTVATNVDAPILLKFPQDILQTGLLANVGRKQAMLGLGDIVLPGMFIALLLRFGSARRTRSYFYVAVTAYATGLIITIFIMHVYRAGQPALLYLVPACVIVPTLWSLIRGEYKELTSFNEEHLAKNSDDDDDDDSEAEQHSFKMKHKKKTAAKKVQ